MTESQSTVNELCDSFSTMERIIDDVRQLMDLFGVVAHSLSSSVMRTMAYCTYRVREKLPEIHTDTHIINMKRRADAG